MQFKNLVINELMQGLNHLLHNVKILWHLILKELLDAIKKKKKEKKNREKIREQSYADLGC